MSPASKKQEAAKTTVVSSTTATTTVRSSVCPILRQTPDQSLIYASRCSMGDMTMVAAAGDEAGRPWTVVGGRKVQKRGSRRRRKRQSN